MNDKAYKLQSEAPKTTPTPKMATVQVLEETISNLNNRIDSLESIIVLLNSRIDGLQAIFAQNINQHKDAEYD